MTTEELLADLDRLSDACARDDARATAAPWIWSDETFLWSVDVDHGVLEHGGTRWPVTPENREAIAAGRNRLPELVRVLRAAATEVAVLRGALVEAIELFDATWCSEHGHAPREDQFARAQVLRQLAGLEEGNYP